MAAQSRPSANALLQPQARRRVSTLNFGVVLIIVGLVGAIVLMVIYGITRLNAPPTDTVVNGAPVTQGAASPQDLGMGGPATSSYASTPDQPIVVQTVHQPIEKPLVVSTPTPVAAQASTSSSSSASTAADEASAERREAQRRAVDAERQQLEQEHQRTDTAMRSLGGVTVAESRDANTGARSSFSDAPAQTAASEYSAPPGPILALDTAIPVALTRSIDSTFPGSVPLDVRSDVLDETGRVVLIPAGSRCFATSSAGGVEGQDRIYVSVKLCKLPDRRRLVFADFPVVDSDGATGVKARVDDHGVGRRNRGSILTSLPALAGTVIPGGGVGESVAIGATETAQQSQVGRAIPGPRSTSTRVRKNRESYPSS